MARKSLTFKECSCIGHHVKRSGNNDEWCFIPHKLLDPGSDSGILMTCGRITTYSIIVNHRADNAVRGNPGGGV